MIFRRLHPEPCVEIDSDTAEGRAVLDELYEVPESPWLRINLIASVNGSAAGADGTSESLTNRLDRRILGTIRRLSDVVLVGAQSVRTEGYFLPKTAPLAILTGSGDLTGHRIPSDVAEGKVIVLCPATAAAKVREILGSPHVSIIEIDTSENSGAVNLVDAIGALRQRGYNSIVCEGGPTLAGRLIEASLVDEVCFSTSPQLSSTHMPAFAGLLTTRPLRLDQLLSDPDGHLFARWRVHNG